MCEVPGAGESTAGLSNPHVQCGWKTGGARRGDLRLERGWGWQIQDSDTRLKGPRAAGGALGGLCAGQPWVQSAL